MRRRYRKRRGNWFPVLGHAVSQNEGQYWRADFRIGGSGQYLEPAPDNQPVTQVIPIVPDITVGQDPNVLYSLKDQVSGQAWQLNRLVGKLHLAAAGPQANPDDPPVDGANWPNVYVVAGFFIGPVADGPPVEQLSPDGFGRDYEPMARYNVGQPWIWRRSWMFSNPNAYTGDNRFVQKAAWPLNNSQEPSSLDGAHIDSKVKRFINAEHRLFFVCQVAGFDQDWITVTGQQNQQPNIAGLLDLRVYGNLRRQRNLSSF